MDVFAVHLGFSLFPGSKIGVNLGSSAVTSQGLHHHLEGNLLRCSPIWGPLWFSRVFPAAGMGRGTRGRFRPGGVQVPFPHLKLIQFGLVG